MNSSTTMDDDTMELDSVWVTKSRWPDCTRRRRSSPPFDYVRRLLLLLQQQQNNLPPAPWRQVVRFRKKRKTANMKKNTYLFAGSNWFLSGLEPAWRSVGWSLASQLLIAPIRLGQHRVLNTHTHRVFVRVDFEPSEESKFASDRPILVHLTCKHHLIITDLRNPTGFSNFWPTARRSAGEIVAQIHFSPYLARLSTKKAFKSLSKTAQITPLLFANPPHQRCICIERRN